MDASEVVQDFSREPGPALTGRRKKGAKDAQKKLKAGSFETMGLGPMVMKGIRRKGYRLPTPIQRKAMPFILQGQDVVGMARTGSGKTAAFVLPLIDRLKEHSTKMGARGLILLPSRELALQTQKVVQELGRFLSLRTAMLVGGDSMEAQFSELASNPDIIVATPGRLMHHLQEVKGMSLTTVQLCIFDEADRLFELGFADQLRLILARLSSQRQTLLFSATLPAGLAEFARAGLRDPAFVRLDAEQQLSPDLTSAFFTIRAEDKLGALSWLCQEVVGDDREQTLVFTSTRHHTELVHSVLAAQGISCACVYGAMDQVARQIATAKFRAGKANVLVVTDVAARGLDIPLLDNVINFDFPAKPKLYVHRAGRVARAGRTGRALSLLTRDELPYLLDLHLFLSRPLQPAPVVPLAEARKAADCLDVASSLYGSFPQVVVADAATRSRTLLEQSETLASLQRSATAAFALYRRTRPAAAPQSVVRAKALPAEGIHPLLAAHVPLNALAGLEDQAGLADITQKLRAYRPAAVVFETEVGKGSRARPEASAQHADQGLPEAAPAAVEEPVQEPVGSKRAAEAALPASKRQRSGSADQGSESESDVSDQSVVEEEDLEPEVIAHPAPGSTKKGKAAAQAAYRLLEADHAGPRFRDDSFFLDARPKDSTSSQGYAVHGDNQGRTDLQAATLDLMADDQEGMATGSRRFHWDKRKRQYVQLQPDEGVRASKRVRSSTESGKRAAKGKSTGLYDRWAARAKTRIGAAGEAEDPRSNSRAREVQDRFKHGGRGWQKQGAESSGGELRRADQIMKERKQQHKRQQRGKPGAKGKGGRGRQDAGDDSGSQPHNHSRSTKKGFAGGSKAAGKSASKAGRVAKGRR